jgi:hypothetical protein
MRILFIVPRTNLIRHFDGVVLALADAGHTVAIATPGRPNDWPLPEAVASHPRVIRPICPDARSDAWKDAATDFRLLVDAGRYLEGPFSGADKLRDRAFRTFAETISGGERTHLSARCPSCNVKILDGELGRMAPSLGAAGPGRLRELARLVEAAIPSDPGRERFLAEQDPDLVLVSPLIGLGSGQADWVKSARALGIPVGFPVFSWDNLTTKGIVHVKPDRVFVWNEVQKREAVEYHDISPDAIEVTGAPRFDAFFAMRPSAGRDEYCAGAGLDPEAPILTYLCSSEFVAGREVEFVEQWVREIRREPSLASASVVIRPHPRSVRQWHGVDVRAWGRASLSLSRQLNADQSLYDALHHSHAVIGLNTSAQLEAGILGKPVLTLLAPGFERGQQGTLHFKYLLRDHGGFVELAAGFDEHRRHLADAVAGRFDAAGLRRFVESFVRPAGWEKPATPVLADAILRLGPARASRVKRWLRSSR